MIGRVVFNVGSATEQEMLGDLPGMLDRIDAWIADGVLGGPQLNAADFMVAPSLALILYRPDVEPSGAACDPENARRYLRDTDLGSPPPGLPRP